MRLPDDYDEYNKGFSPIVMTAMVAVIVFVAAIIILVLSSDTGKKRNTRQQVESSALFPSVIEKEPETVTSGKLTPDDLDFWDMYPEEPESESSVAPEPSSEPEPVKNDPSTDGKHTLVQYADGKEEWVLISPYLPKHSYDFTKLVCQSDLMKYYVNGKQASFVGIDISKYQEYVDFNRVKRAGIQFVMIRVGSRGYGSGQLVLDDSFADNIKRATDAGLEVGVYFSSQAITVDEVLEEANLVIESLQGYTINYPVAFDMEFVLNDTARIESLNRAEKTELAKTFLDTMEANGYKSMLYGDKEWLIKEIDMSKLTAYDVWLSQIADLPDYPYKFAMWQYMNEATVDGVTGYVNLDISFVDYREK